MISNANESRKAIHETANSFFNHTGFNFASSTSRLSEGEGSLKLTPEAEREMDNLKGVLENKTKPGMSNRIKLVIYNPRVIKGDILHGIVKLETDSSLEEGHVELILESVIKINKPWNRSTMNFNEFVIRYKASIKDWNNDVKPEIEIQRKNTKNLTKKNNNWDKPTRRKLSRKRTQGHKRGYSGSKREIIFGGIKQLSFASMRKKTKKKITKRVKTKTSKAFNRQGSSLTPSKNYLYKKSTTNLTKFYRPSLFHRAKTKHKELLKNKRTSKFTSNQDNALNTPKLTVGDPATPVRFLNPSPKASSRNHSHSSNQNEESKLNVGINLLNNNQNQPQKSPQNSHFDIDQLKDGRMTPAENPSEVKFNFNSAIKNSQNLGSNVSLDGSENQRMIAARPTLLKYENYLLSKSRRILFRLDQRVKQKTMLILPFKVRLPQDLAPSHDQYIYDNDKIGASRLHRRRLRLLNKLSNKSISVKVNGVEKRRNTMVGIQKFDQKQIGEIVRSKSPNLPVSGNSYAPQEVAKDSSQMIQNMIQNKLSDMKNEGVVVEHNLIVYFIPKKSVKAFVNQATEKFDLIFHQQNKNTLIDKQPFVIEREFKTKDLANVRDIVQLAIKKLGCCKSRKKPKKEPRKNRDHKKKLEDTKEGDSRLKKSQQGGWLTFLSNKLFCGMFTEQIKQIFFMVELSRTKLSSDDPSLALRMTFDQFLTQNYDYIDVVIVCKFKYYKGEEIVEEFKLFWDEKELRSSNNSNGGDSSSSDSSESSDIENGINSDKKKKRKRYLKQGTVLEVGLGKKLKDSDIELELISEDLSKSPDQSLRKNVFKKLNDDYKMRSKKKLHIPLRKGSTKKLKMRKLETFFENKEVVLRNVVDKSKMSELPDFLKFEGKQYSDAHLQLPSSYMSSGSMHQSGRLNKMKSIKMREGVQKKYKTENQENIYTTTHLNKEKSQTLDQKSNYIIYANSINANLKRGVQVEKVERSKNSLKNRKGASQYGNRGAKTSMIPASEVINSMNSTNFSSFLPRLRVPREVDGKKLISVGSIIDLSKLRSSLETVCTRFVDVDYKLKIYISDKPYGLKNEVYERRIVFIKNPPSYIDIESKKLSRLNTCLERRIMLKEDIILLPYSKVRLV